MEDSDAAFPTESAAATWARQFQADALTLAARMLEIAWLDATWAAILEAENMAAVTFDASARAYWLQRQRHLKGELNRFTDSVLRPGGRPN